MELQLKTCLTHKYQETDFDTRAGSITALMPTQIGCYYITHQIEVHFLLFALYTT